jgi:hypothetical protein
VAVLGRTVRTIAGGKAIQQWLQPDTWSADIAVMNLHHVHSPSWMFRLVARRPAPSPSSQMHSRIEVCPPELWPSSLSWRGRLQRWHQRLVGQLAPWLPAPARPVNRLSLVKAEFADSVSDLEAPVQQPLLDRIERARSLRELWHLRSSVYGQVALALTQGEAERRLAGLNRHFPVRAPRSGVMPLDR